MSDSDTDYASKAQFINAVRDNGASLGETEYFTEGSGSATTYKKRDADGDVEEITKADVQAAWEATQESSSSESDETSDSTEEIHLGTFYYASAWDEDEHRETLETLLSDAGWYIDGEVDSGGYRLKTECWD